jgi:glutathione S-transferase
MKLYYFDTLQPRKVCAAAKYLEAPVEYVYVDLLKGEQRSPRYLALNPNGKVPTLTDGEKILWEADAIMASDRGHSLVQLEFSAFQSRRWRALFRAHGESAFPAGRAQCGRGRASVAGFSRLCRHPQRSSSEKTLASRRFIDPRRFFRRRRLAVRRRQSHAGARIS